MSGHFRRIYSGYLVGVPVGPFLSELLGAINKACSFFLLPRREGRDQSFSLVQYTFP